MEDEDKNSKSFGKPCGFETHHRHSIIKQLRIERFLAVFLFLLSFLYFGVFWEDTDDCIRRGHLTGEIQMCINVACCADVTVTKPLLNFLQAHPVGIKQTGAAMAQVVETDFSSSIWMIFRIISILSCCGCFFAFASLL